MNLSPAILTKLSTIGLTSGAAADILGCGTRTAGRLLREAGAVNRSGRWFHVSITRPPWTGTTCR